MKYIKLKEKVYLSKLSKKFKNCKIYINKICPKDNIMANSLVFINKKKYLGEKLPNKAVILTDLKKNKKNLVFVRSPRLEFAKIFNLLMNKNLIIINKIQNNISKLSKISSKSILDQNIQIGKNSIIEDGAIIKENTIIGENCIIRSGAVIGALSFSFERTHKKIYHMPISGGVSIGDNSIIGSNSVISKGTFGFTKIGNNTMIDTLVQIAHNSRIGNNVTITGGSNIGGSVKIEDNVLISPCSNIINNVTIGKNSHIGIGSVVIKNVKKNKKVFGNPGREI